jgi:hypothetical protein
MKQLVRILLAFTAFAIGATPHASEPRSSYTEISPKDCELIPASDEPGDEDGLRCPGPAGYGLLALSGDLRATVTIVAPDGSEHPLEFWQTISGHFSTLGPRAEWRLRESDGIPRALIVRVFANEDPEHPDKRTSYLAVAKITPGETCVTDRILGGADDNARARAAADESANRPCVEALEPEGSRE